MASVTQPISSRKTTTAASYERVSSLIQGKYGYSLGAQEKSARQFCAERVWDLPEDLIFKDGEDRDASGKDWDLPALNAMIDAAKAGRFTTLVVPSPDRFARSMVKALVLEEQLRASGVEVVYQNIPIEAATAETRMMRGQLHVFAEYEREKIKLRTWTGRRAKAEKGVYVGSEPCPFGYTFTREVERLGKKRVNGLAADETTAPIVRLIYMLAPQMPMNQIALYLNGKRPDGSKAPPIPAPHGKHWWGDTIRAILRNPMYKGVKTWNRIPTTTKAGNPGRGDFATGIVIPCTPLVSAAAWDAAQIALDERRAFGWRGARSRSDFPLRSLLVCDHCGGGLTCRVILKTYRYYQCGTRRPSDAEKRGKTVCPLPPVPAREMDEHVKTVVTNAFLDPERIDAMIRATIEERDAADHPRIERLAIIGKEIATRRRKMDRITSELLDADEDSETYASLKRTQATLNKEVGQFTTEQTKLEGECPKILTTEQALSLQEAAGRIKANMADASLETLQELYGLIGLRGRVTCDPLEGLLFGKHRLTIDWQAAIPLPRSQSILL